MGFLLLISSWPIVLAAVALLRFGPPQFLFLLVALAMAAAGLLFVAFSFIPAGGRSR